METLKQPFNPAQIGILNTMAQLNTDSDLIELKKVVSEFFAERADREMDNFGTKKPSTAKRLMTRVKCICARNEIMFLVK